MSLRAVKRAISAKANALEAEFVTGAEPGDLVASAAAQQVKGLRMAMGIIAAQPDAEPVQVTEPTGDGAKRLIADEIYAAAMDGQRAPGRQVSFVDSNGRALGLMDRLGIPR